MTRPLPALAAALLLAPPLPPRIASTSSDPTRPRWRRGGDYNYVVPP